MSVVAILITLCNIIFYTAIHFTASKEVRYEQEARIAAVFSLVMIGFNLYLLAYISLDW